MHVYMCIYFVYVCVCIIMYYSVYYYRKSLFAVILNDYTFSW